MNAVAQVYYYNARTRESAWTKPDNVKIMLQSEIEAMATGQQPLPAAMINNAAGGPGHIRPMGMGPSSAAQATVAQGTSCTLCCSVYNLLVVTIAVCVFLLVLLPSAGIKSASRQLRKSAPFHCPRTVCSAIQDNKC